MCVFEAKKRKHAGMITATHLVKFQGGDLRILSDANTEFIRVILEHYGLADRFSTVATNPAEYSPEGKLHVKPLQWQKDCTRCPPNLCKGVELLLASRSCSLVCVLVLT